MNFKEGDRVRIIKDSYHYGRNSGNPKDIIGTIIECDDGINYYRVEWDRTNRLQGSKTKNSYVSDDLEKVHKYSFTRLYKFPYSN